MSKKPFLLFELLIALSLMGVLLSFLFSFMIQSVRLEKKIECARHFILERQHLQSRLSDLLTSLCPNGSQPSLYTQIFPKEEKESLIAISDHGIDIDPAFGGLLLSRLFIDEKRNLCLVSWPLSDSAERPWRKEILLSKVSDISLSFLSTNTPQAPVWSPTWPKDKQHPPSMIRMNIKQENASVAFAFPIPSASPMVLYEKLR